MCTEHACALAVEEGVHTALTTALSTALTLDEPEEALSTALTLDEPEEARTTALTGDSEGGRLLSSRPPHPTLPHQSRAEPSPAQPSAWPSVAQRSAAQPSLAQRSPAQPSLAQSRQDCLYWASTAILALTADSAMRSHLAIQSGAAEALRAAMAQAKLARAP